MSVSTSIPKGTRDFSPVEMNRRRYIFDLLTDVFRLYAYQPIETPAMENLSTLTGKYGEEGDRLIFKILNSGDFLEGIDEGNLKDISRPRLAASICEKALRYDLTVPFARYVVQHKSEITFPFKRYQIQPVWRADRPQRGRYREFFQCDVDAIGTNSLLAEVELIQIMDEVFEKLGIRVNIRMNNRKILIGIAEALGLSDKFTDMTVAMDKLDKAGPEKVREELAAKDISNESIDRLFSVMKSDSDPEKVLAILEPMIGGTEIGRQGIKEIRDIFEYLKNLSLKSPLILDLSLARGLNYYTGAIFEVKATDVAMGSICGGGRYDDLTGIFGLPGLSGVGVSFGADRIYDVMNELKLFPEEAAANTRILFANFGGEEEKHSLRILSDVRKQGISAEIYPEAAKMKKQFAYADDKKIPYVAIIGSEERENGTISLKNMQSGEQKTVSVEALGGIVNHLF